MSPVSACAGAAAEGTTLLWHAEAAALLQAGILLGFFVACLVCRMGDSPSAERRR